jgi:hypothetical protein
MVVTMGESSFWPDDVVKSFRTWCQVSGLSVATGKRLIKSGQGPIITRLSKGRVGIRGRHHRLWLDQRTINSDLPSTGRQ